MKTAFEINGRRIGSQEKVYIVAEMSANHNHDLDHAVRIVKAAKAAGADAVKVQTFLPETITLRCDNENFRIKGDSPWTGRDLHDLYREAYMPWEWQPKLKSVAEEEGIDFFSTVFDPSSVDFLEDMGVPAYKISSFEIVDIPLIERVAGTGKPVILSTGMAGLEEIEEALEAAGRSGASNLALLKCTSAYPAPPEEMNLRSIPHMAKTFGVPVGLSDHSLGTSVSLAAVALGACIVEKHLALSRKDKGLDSSFSMEPAEFKEMVESIRIVEKALGGISYEVSEKERGSRVFRKSLFVVKNMEKNEAFSPENVKSIRPGHGLHPRYLAKILGQRSSRSIEKGTPLSWDLLNP
jgi:pseudaminic acid synthase